MVGDSSTIWVTVPEYLGDAAPALVDVVVTNLDDDGDPITGETVTETDAYTYKRQSLVAEGALSWVHDNLLLWFRRNVLDNTVSTTDPEYSDDPAGGIIALGALPGVVLAGPTVVPDPLRENLHENDILTDTGLYIVEKPRRAKKLGYQVHAFGRTKAEILNLQEHIDGAVSARARLRMLDHRGGSDTLDLQIQIADSWSSSDDTTTHIRRAMNSLEVSGVRLRIAYGNETGPQASPDQPVVWESDDDPLTLEITSGVE